MTLLSKPEPEKTKCFSTLVGVKYVDILRELGALVSSSLTQASQKAQPPAGIPYDTSVRSFARHCGERAPGACLGIIQLKGLDRPFTLATT